MAVSIVMPALEMAQETGKIVSWLKREGDVISKGEPIAEIETDKVVLELEAAADGILAGVKAADGDVIQVGKTIAWIVAPGETAPSDEESTAPGARTMTEQSQAAILLSSAPAPASVQKSEAKVSPKARRLAQEFGVDLNTLAGTGPGGVISGEDVQRVVDQKSALAAAAAPTSMLAGAPALNSVARLMAERTAQSWAAIPHFSLLREIEASAMVSARETKGKSVSYTDLLVATVARTLVRHPKLNARWNRNSIQYNPDINVTVAVAVAEGVVGAVIPNADRATLSTISARRRDVAQRAREGRLRPPDVANGTFTISNLGMFDVDSFSAIITSPQTAILAVGRIVDRVVAIKKSMMAVRPMMTMTLSADHRVVDGAQAAAFLKDLAEALTDPAQLALSTD